MAQPEKMIYKSFPPSPDQKIVSGHGPPKNRLRNAAKYVESRIGGIWPENFIDIPNMKSDDCNHVLSSSPNTVYQSPP